MNIHASTHCACCMTHSSMHTHHTLPSHGSSIVFPMYLMLLQGGSGCSEQFTLGSFLDSAVVEGSIVILVHGGAAPAGYGA